MMSTIGSLASWVAVRTPLNMLITTGKDLCAGSTSFSLRVAFGIVVFQDVVDVVLIPAEGRDDDAWVRLPDVRLVDPRRFGLVWEVLRGLRVVGEARPNGRWRNAGVPGNVSLCLMPPSARTAGIEDRFSGSESRSADL